MIRTCAVATGIALVAGQRAEAANVSVILAPPNILQVVVLVGAVACLVIASKLLALVRGGLLARGVQMFVGAFAALSLGQLAVLVQKMEIVSVPSFVGPLMLTVTAGLLLYGLLQVRRVLS